MTCEDVQTPLHFATQFRCLEATKILIEAGANIDAQDGISKPSLHFATKNNHTDVAEYLREHGADPGSCHREVSIVLENGWSATIVVREQGEDMTDEAIIEMIRTMPFPSAVREIQPR